MIKSVILFTLNLFLVFSFNAYSSNFFVINASIVKGKYKSLVVKSYCDMNQKDTLIQWERCYYDDYDSILCDTRGNALASYKFDANWEVHSTFFEYDNLSNRISLKSIDSNGKVLNYTKSSYKFDHKGRIIEETDTSIVDGIVNNPIVIKGKAIYDENGNKTEDQLIDAKGALTSKNEYKYNESHKVVEETQLSGEGKIWVRAVFGLDDRGNRNSWERYDVHGNLTSRIIKEYDKNNNLTEQTEYEGRDGQMKFLFRATLKYDQDNNQTEVSYYNEKGDLISQVFYFYKYDSHRNWIECTGGDSKSPGKKIVRKIEYY